MSGLGIIAVTPAVALAAHDGGTASAGTRNLLSLADASIAIAACRSGATGIVNLEFTDTTAAGTVESISAVVRELREFAGSNRCGIKCDITQIEELKGTLAALTEFAQPEEFAATVILAVSNAPTQKLLQKSIHSLHEHRLFVAIECVSLNEAKNAAASGADAVVVKGQEGAGRVGEQTSFVLLQECANAIKVPLWVCGGIGLHTAAACHVAGAKAVILESQLLLAPECNIPLPVKQKFTTLDGTETSIVGDASVGGYRVFTRQHLNLQDADQAADENCAQASTASSSAKTFASVRKKFQDSLALKPLDRLYVLGQDIAFASDLTRRFATVGGIIQAIQAAVKDHTESAISTKPLAANAPLAVSHGTEYPLVQGAMTRVSDTAGFALKVAEGGALPFLALALMRNAEVDVLLAKTKEELGPLPWGVGILGFVPQQLRQEQLDAISKYRPPFALIAGGRPDQAKHLEDMGIKTYLHVPSPMLLESFIEMGSRRFIFEGRECGGHVGPRSSFVLWEAMVEKLLSAIGPKDDATAYHVLFAGGVHDGLSAAMVSALAAPLAARGVRVGALMGTAYLFTTEAVATGAIVKKFQEAAIKCDQTVLLETGPGHAIRCIDSPYKRTFDDRRTELVLEKKSRDEVREDLELMNLGRLRIASKGLTRATSLDRDAVIAEFSKQTAAAKKENLAEVPEDQQWSEGMYMIGQVAAMHNKVCSIKELHEDVATGSTKQLDLIAQTAASKPNVTVTDNSRKPGEPIAIVGMACLFPKASDVSTYWSNILNKVDAITEVPEDQWDWRNYYDKDPQARDKISSKWGGFLEDVKFDATRYGIPPSSLNSIDPMQLLLLDVTRSALDNAGYSERNFERQKTSVIVANAGHGPITALYSLRSMIGWKLSHLDDETKNSIYDRLPEWTEDSFPGYLGNVVAGRVANRYDLGGINFTVDAACGSSLAALYVGISELRHHNSDVVLLGAADTHNQPGDFLSFSKTHAFSPKGRCRTFDAAADGIVISEGMAMVVLKRLADAERDGDQIYAVIRGIGGSSDGRDLSLTAPRPAGQVLALNRAYEDAGISPSTVTLVEAHGTGTVAGDRAEIDALKQVYGKAGTRQRSCAVGSVKTMIGHTKAAAGLASLIKISKALHHKVLPPTIGVTDPNPSCDFDSSPFYINSEVRPWVNPTANLGSGSELPRRAGVSAFGFGGTNFHVVLEEYIPKGQSAETTGSVRWSSEMFIVKAKSRADLIRSIDSLAESAKKWINAGEPNKDALRLLSYSTYLKQIERVEPTENKESKTEQLCASFVATSLEDLVEKLQRAKQEVGDGAKTEIRDPRGIYFVDLTDEQRAKVAHGKIAFLFSGQGSQHVDMLKDLAVEFDEVRETMERANAALRGRFDGSLTSYIYPPPAFTDEERKNQLNRLTDTQIAQPAVGAADTGVFRLLTRFGLKPDMVAGHSYGEYVALAAAGAINEHDLIQISEVRGRILSHTNGDGRGSMAAFACTKETAQKILQHCPGVTLANVNSPNQCIVSGAAPKIANAVELAKKSGVQAKEIAVSQAFHSSHMAHSQAPLRSALQTLTIRPPRIPVYSNTNAKPYQGGADKIVDQLVEHIVQPVDFVAEVTQMQADGATMFVEVGPGSVLAGLTDAILQTNSAPYLVLSTDRAGRGSLVHFMHTLAQLAAYGQSIDLERLFVGRITTQECINLRLTAPAEVAPKKGLTYLVNSSRVQRIGAAEKPKPNTSAAGQPVSPEIQKPETQSKKTGVSVSSQLKPNSSSVNTPAPTNGGAINTNGHGNNGHQTMPTSPNKSTSPNLPAPPNQTAQSSFNSSPANVLQPMSPQQMGGRNVDQVMLQFQQTMLQMTNSFLETQQRVMLAYLNVKSGNSVPSPFTNGNPGNSSSLVPALQNQASNFAGNITPALQPQPAQFHQQPFEVPAPASVTGNGHDLFGNGHGTASNGHSNGHQEIDQSEPTTTPIEPEAVAESVSASAEIDSDKLIAALLDIVSERTGYPPDMLDPTLDLEADLGIDSIKRVEILNSFRKVLPLAKQQELEGGIEELAGTKTLQGIMDWIRSDASAGSAKKKRSQSTDIKPATTNGANGQNGTGNGAHVAVVKPLIAKRKIQEVTIDSSISRALVRPIELSQTLMPKRAIADGVWLIIDDGGSAGEALQAKLALQGRKLARLSHDRHGSSNQNSGDLTDEPTVRKLIESIRTQHGRIAGLLHVVALGTNASERAALYSLFQVARVLETDLNRKSENTLLVAAHKLGGAFGIFEAPTNVCDAGIAGVVKSLAKEWPNVEAKSLDFEPELGLDSIVDHIAEEIDHGDPRIEVGFFKDSKFGLHVEPTVIEQNVEKLQLDEKSVVLITGGARGITAEIARQLGEVYSPTLIIVGRSEKPGSPESPATANYTAARDIKGAIIEQLKAEQKQVNVANVEAIYQRIIRDREIASNLSALEELGCTVEYHALDVRDDAAFGGLIESTYEKYGHIDGVIHGAGVIEDAYAKDKSLDSFRRVVETKVLGGLTLRNHLRLDELKFLFFFSSVVGRTGNAGQTDYVAANEIVNKLASSLREQTNARVASLMWGPWRGGMAQPELEAIFAKYGWAMIDPVQGRLAFMDELHFGQKDDVEVLLVAEVGVEPKMRGAKIFSASATAPAPGVAEIVVTLDTTNDIFLNDHTFDGVPVMPMAMAVEMMMESAQSAFPGYRAEEVMDLDIPSGIVFESASKPVTIRTQIIERCEQYITVATVLGAGSPMKRANFKAKVRLVKETIPIGALSSIPGWLATKINPEEEMRKVENPVVEPPTAQKIYAEWFFHGPVFQGVQNISVIGSHGVCGEITSSQPTRCFTQTNGERWVIDPVAMDSAMQLAGCWARQTLDITALPARFKSLRRMSEKYSDKLFVRVFINPSDSPLELTCDIAVYNEDGNVAFVLEKLHGVGSKSLNRLASQSAATGLAR